MTPMDFDENKASNILAGLPDYEPDRQRSERIRMLCHAALSAREMKVKVVPSPPQASFWKRVFEPAAIAAVCALYLTEVARHALALYGF